MTRDSKILREFVRIFSDSRILAESDGLITQNADNLVHAVKFFSDTPANLEEAIEVIDSYEMGRISDDWMGKLHALLGAAAKHDANAGYYPAATPLMVCYVVESGDTNITSDAFNAVVSWFGDANVYESAGRNKRGNILREGLALKIAGASDKMTDELVLIGEKILIDSSDEAAELAKSIKDPSFNASMIDGRSAVSYSNGVYKREGPTNLGFKKALVDSLVNTHIIDDLPADITGVIVEIERKTGKQFTKTVRNLQKALDAINVDPDAYRRLEAILGDSDAVDDFAELLEREIARNRKKFSDIITGEAMANIARAAVAKQGGLGSVAPVKYAAAAGKTGDIGAAVGRGAAKAVVGTLKNAGWIAGAVATLGTIQGFLDLISLSDPSTLTVPELENLTAESFKAMKNSATKLAAEVRAADDKGAYRKLYNDLITLSTTENL